MVGKRAKERGLIGGNYAEPIGLNEGVSVKREARRALGGRARPITARVRAKGGRVVSGRPGQGLFCVFLARILFKMCSSMETFLLLYISQSYGKQLEGYEERESQAK